MLHLIPKKDNLKILCLGAHSDDIEIGCGGALLKILKENSIEQVEWIVFATNEQRKIEAETSAKNYLYGLNKANVSIYEFRDGFLPYHAIEIKEKFEEIKKRINPDIIFTHYRDDRHQDHRLISDLTWNTFRDNMILEYEIPKWDGDIGNPNFYVELNEKILNKRNQLLKDCFITQKGKHWFKEEMFRSLARIRGMESACEFAEAFYARKINIF